MEKPKQNSIECKKKKKIDVSQLEFIFHFISAADKHFLRARARFSAADDFVQNTRNFAAGTGCQWKLIWSVHVFSSFFFFNLSFSSTLTSLALSTLITSHCERKKRANFSITSTWRMHDSPNFFLAFFFFFRFYMKNSRNGNF